MHCFSTSMQLYMFRTDLLSVVGGLGTVFTATGICHAKYVDCLLAKLRWNKCQLLWTQCQDCWWKAVSLSETCSVVYQNKAEKQCNLLACIVRVCRNARSSEHKNSVRSCGHVSNMTLSCQACCVFMFSCNLVIYIYVCVCVCIEVVY